jgi:cytochrome c
MRRFCWIALATVLAGCVPVDESENVVPAGESSARVFVDRGGSDDSPEGGYGYGRPATEAEIAAWDIDVGPDGAGLPAGSATVEDGLEFYAAKCAVCHGADGTGGPNDVLAGRLPGDAFPFANEAVRSTVGNYWPYATTLFDYIRRAMPFDAPGSLTDAEVYASVAAVLHLNDLVPAGAVVDAQTIANLRMPSRDRFVRDDRTGGPTIR